MKSVTIEKIVFELEARESGIVFAMKAYYLKPPHNGDALVEIFKDGKPYKRFLFPAYKIWNIGAHWHDIVDSELAGNRQGYDLAGWDGFQVIEPQELNP